MTLQDFILKYEFKSLVPFLKAIENKAPKNLKLLKESYDKLREMAPGVADEMIVVGTRVEVDQDGIEKSRGLYVSGCENDTWDECLAKTVVFGTIIGEQAALAQILWYLTLRET